MIGEKNEGRLLDEKNIWLASVRGSGRPHLVPIWFVWQGGVFYMCMKSGSVKAKNIAGIPLVSLSLEDGSNVVICEGTAETVHLPYDESVLAEFKRKYDWDIMTDEDGYDLMVRVVPNKWLSW